MSFIYLKDAGNWRVVGGGPTRHDKVVTFPTNPHKRAIHAHLARCVINKSITGYDHDSVDDLEESLETGSDESENI